MSRLKSLLEKVLDASFTSIPNKICLTELAKELQMEGIEDLQNETILDRILLARLSHETNQDSTFDYLVDSFKRLNSEAKYINTYDTLAVSTLQKLLVSYAGIVLQMPDMFPQPDAFRLKGAGVFIDRLLSSAFDFPPDFLHVFIERFRGDGLDEIFTEAFSYLSNIASQRNLSNEYQSVLNVLVMLLQSKDLALIFVSHPQFVNAASPQTVEMSSLLGPFFRFGLLADSRTNLYFFSNVRERNGGDLHGTVVTLQTTLDSLITSYHQLVLTLIKSSPEGKDRVLSLVGEALRLNVKRAQLQVDPATVSSDGFVFAMNSVLVRLCEPFMDAPNFQKVHLIDPLYLGRCSDERFQQLNILQETKIASNEEESNSFWVELRGKEHSGKAPNFISEVFHLTLSCFHIGLTRLAINYDDFNRQLEEMEKAVERMKQEKASRTGMWNPSNPHAANPAMELMFQRAVTKLQQQLATKYAMDTCIMDRRNLERAILFYSLVINWLLRIIALELFPGQVLSNVPTSSRELQNVFKDKLPLPAPPRIVRMLPEWYFEDIAAMYLFVAKYMPHIFISVAMLDELITFGIVLMVSEGYVKNPYLKANFIEIFFFLTLEYQGRPRGLSEVFHSHPFALNHLGQALIHSYVVVEHTGASTQFYDKFNIRYNISQVLKNIWQNPHHRQILKQVSQLDDFIRFVNLLINDTTYLLDESFSKLSEIRKLEKEMEDLQTWNALSEEQISEKETYYKQLKRQAKSVMSLGNETVHMMAFLTTEISEPFLKPEVIDRLTAMLGYNLKGLVGPTRTGLKVNRPEKYRFQPKILLSELLDVFLHLAPNSEFIAAVGRDGRSYKREYFAAAVHLMQGSMLKKPDELTALMQFVDCVDEWIVKENCREQELGDVPDEFLDPLMFSIMEDPVILPTSGVTIDRSTIKSHLLSDATDPFNRKPLTIDEVVDNVELKAKIQAFVNKH